MRPNPSTGILTSYRHDAATFRSESGTRTVTASAKRLEARGTAGRLEPAVVVSTWGREQCVWVGQRGGCNKRKWVGDILGEIVDKDKNLDSRSNLNLGYTKGDHNESSGEPFRFLSDHTRARLCRL